MERLLYDRHCTARCLPQILTTALQIGNSGLLKKKTNLPRIIIQLQVQELGFHARPSEQKNAPVCATRS